MAKKDLILIDNKLVDTSKLSSDQLGEMIKNCDSFTTCDHLTEEQIFDRYGIITGELQKEIEILKNTIRESLPEDCIEGYGEVKYCPNRLGDGNKCKRCDNL